MVNETWRCGGECRGSWKRVEQQPVVALAKKLTAPNFDLEIELSQLATLLAYSIFFG